MPFPDYPAPLIVIVGPTAVGKTEVSLQLAERLNGEIISADSRLFYRGMDVGTAKPTEEERARVLHHLIDVAGPGEHWSLTIYQEKAREIIEQVYQRGRLPFLVGGTGQYIRAVIETWQPPAQPPDTTLRDVLERWGRELGPLGLHARLAVLDPEAAAQIDPSNMRRTVRALEVILHSGRRFSVQRQKSGAAPYSLLQIGLIRPRPELYARIDARIDAMFAAGLVEEVKALQSAGYAPEHPAMSAIGYREVSAFLRGESTLEDAVILMRRYTRNFVRRQANWFRQNNPQIHWFDLDTASVDQIEAFIRSGQGWIPGQTEN